MITLGIDTSNYTTSVALYNDESRVICQKKKLLPVKQGEKGLRQSDAVFHHTVQLPELIEDLLSGTDNEIDCVCSSAFPRDVKGSYMPCFLVGLGVGRSVSKALKVPFYTVSHQAGHITAALYSCGRLDLMNSCFIAFHVSGGTTEMLYVTPDSEKIFNVAVIGSTRDINAGQLVDRVGVAMGLDFPCGAAVEKLSAGHTNIFNVKTCVSDGSCNLSGAENICKKMLADGVSKADVSYFCLSFVYETLRKMTLFAVNKYGNLPLIFAGGVMSNSFIRDSVTREFGNAYFAERDFSCDNAAGVSILGSKLFSGRDI